MIERISEILQQAGYDLSARELSEILWLAVHLDESLISDQQLSIPSQQPTKQVVQEDRSPIETIETSELPLTSQPDKPTADVFLPSTVKSSSNTSFPRETVSIQIPAASSLRNSLALSRALRPLMRKVPSPTENILDEEATVRRIAEADIWAPVLKPAPQRWLELALVVEQTSTTAVWKQTITELQKLLKHHGAFRDVRTWKLEITNSNVQLFPQNSIGTYSTTSYKPEVLIDPKGQRLILLITDCISPAWRNRLIHPVLDLWGRKGLVTILQLLPERLWERTALVSEIPVQLRSLNPATSNSKLIADGELQTNEQIQNYIPVITLEPSPLCIWSKVLVGSGNLTTAGFKFSACNNSVQTSPPTHNSALKTQHLVSRFRATASPIARKLAGLIAAAPISLPVIQLIQQTLLPQSGQIHVAEVLMSGLLKPLPNAHQDNNLNYIEYDFIEGVRELLLDSVPISKTTSVLDIVSEYIAKQLGISVTEFNARLLTPSSPTNDTLETQIRPFAQLKAQVLRSLGGVYSNIAQELDQTSQPKVQLISEAGIDYTNLRNLLAAGKWQEADAETANVMLRAVGKEVLPNQFLFSDDIAKLPCIDLNTIDQLWETYTQGRFSFSAQKRILQEVSSTTLNENETAIKWGERLGWHVNNEWLYLFSQLQYTLNSPSGHFPAQWLPDVFATQPNTDISLFPSFVWGGDSWRCLTTLIQKLADCNFNDSSHKLSKFEFDVITINKKGEEIKRERGQAQYFIEDLGNNVSLEMVAIPGGNFMMGSPDGEGNDNERPQHEVTIPSFFMGKYPITQAQWRAVAALPRVERYLRAYPTLIKGFRGDNFPIEYVSWYDAVEYCARLSKKTGRLYRLPSEAEWEYACRAGTTTPFHFGETITDKLANCNTNFTFTNTRRRENIEKTRAVGRFPPNAFGLHDMHGLVWQWCLDTYHSNYETAPTDGSAWVDQVEIQDKSFEQNQGIVSRLGKLLINILERKSNNDNQITIDRLLRGGAWDYSPQDCRSAYRFSFHPANYLILSFGFRVVCSNTVRTI